MYSINAMSDVVCYVCHAQVMNPSLRATGIAILSALGALLFGLDIGWKYVGLIDTAMGQNPLPPVSIPIPTKIGNLKWVMHLQTNKGSR